MTLTPQTFDGGTNGQTYTLSLSQATGPGFTPNVGAGGAITFTTVAAQKVNGISAVKIVAGGSAAATYISTSLTGFGTARGRYAILGFPAAPVGPSTMIVAQMRATGVCFSVSMKSSGFMKISSSAADLVLFPGGGTGTLQQQTPTAMSFAGGGVPTFVAFDVYVDIPTGNVHCAFLDPITGAFALGMTAYTVVTGASIGSGNLTTMTFGKPSGETLTSAFTMYVDKTNDMDSNASAVGVTNGAMIWNGSAWVRHIPNIWTGSAWAQYPANIAP